MISIYSGLSATVYYPSHATLIEYNNTYSILIRLSNGETTKICFSDSPSSRCSCLNINGQPFRYKDILNNADKIKALIEKENVLKAIETLP